MSRYDAMTDDDFDNLLVEIIEDVSRTTLLQIPGVYELVAEHFNNDVLARWDELHQPNEDDES